MNRQGKDTYEGLIKQGNEVLYKQSAQVSSICRKVIYALFATIWALSYKDGSFYIPHGIMFWTLVACVVFLFVDILHYFRETCFMHKIIHYAYNRGKQSDEISQDDANKYVENSKRSFRYICYKFGITVFAMTLFGWAVIANGKTICCCLLFKKLLEFLKNLNLMNTISIIALVLAVAGIVISVIALIKSRKGK